MTSIPLNNQCPCGSMYLGMGSAFSVSGLCAELSSQTNSIELALLHSTDIYLESGENFVTVTPIITESITPNKITIKYKVNKNIEIKNVIQVIIKDKLSKSILGTRYIGKYTSSQILQTITVDLHTNIDINNNAIIIEIRSLCDNMSDPCCDRLPSEINIEGPRLLCVPLEKYYVLPTTTTTTTPEPFIVEFITHPTNQIVNANTKATFSFSAITMRDVDFTYWWERSNDSGSSWKKASRLSIGKSRKLHSLIVHASLQMHETKYRVVITDPKIKYSNVATLFVIQPTTTTTTTTTFNPVTTTLPPCDLQIFGFDSFTTTTTNAPLLPNRSYFGCPAYVVTGGPEWANGTYKAVKYTNPSAELYSSDPILLKETSGAYPPTWIQLSNNVGIIEWRLYNTYPEAPSSQVYWYSSNGIYFVGFDEDAGLPIYSDSEGGSPKSFGQLFDNGPQSGNWMGIGGDYATGTLNLTIVPQTNCSSLILIEQT